MSREPAPRPEALRPGLLQHLEERPRRVLLLRASRIGDFVIATPAFRAICTALPEAHIALVALPHARELAARSSHLDEFICFPGFPGIAEQFFDARQTVEFFREVQAREFDLCIQMHGTGVFSNPFALMMGARKTAGFIREGDEPGRLVAALPFPGNSHAVHALLALMEFLGMPRCGERLEFPLLEDDHAAAAQALVGAAPPLIGIHAGARDPRKAWAPGSFADAACELRDGAGEPSSSSAVPKKMTVA